MANSKEGYTFVRIETEKGNIEIVLFEAQAPITTKNFLRYVSNHYYDNGQFHRTVTIENQPENPVKIEVIQAGPGRESGKWFPPISVERTSLTGIHHVSGTISMARDEPDTATSNFFICVSDQPELDQGGKRNPDGQGFAAFGRVINGMDVVQKIHESPSHEQTLTPPIKIYRTRVYQP